MALEAHPQLASKVTESHPVAPSGTTSVSHRGLGVARPVRGPYDEAGDRPGPRRHWRTTAPRCPSWGTRPRSASAHAAPSSWYSTFSIPVCWAQALPPMRTEPALDLGPVTRHVDAGLGLDRPLLRPAALGPVGLELVEPGHLEIDQPLGGGHVAVEPRHHHPHGEAVLHRQRLAVHGDGQHRVAVVGERRRAAYRSSSRRGRSAAPRRRRASRRPRRAAHGRVRRTTRRCR